MILKKDITSIGKFQKTHALKGELNAILDIDDSFLTEGNAIIIEVDGILVPFYASSIRPKGATTFLIKLEGIDSEQDAKSFVNKTIFGLKSEIAPFLDVEEEDLSDGEELVGYNVVDASSGEKLGEIIQIDSSTENLLFIVSDENDDSLYIPAVEEFILKVDDDKKDIIMKIPEGLIDLNKKKK